MTRQQQNGDYILSPREDPSTADIVSHALAVEVNTTFSIPTNGHSNVWRSLNSRVYLQDVNSPMLESFCLACVSVYVLVYVSKFSRCQKSLSLFVDFML